MIPATKIELGLFSGERLNEENAGMKTYLLVISLSLCGPALADPASGQSPPLDKYKCYYAGRAYSVGAQINMPTADGRTPFACRYMKVDETPAIQGNGEEDIWSASWVKLDDD
jgi:hypothetical protein